MNKEVKDKWLTALRSGEYKQGQAYMRTDHDEYCCLGVLCELAVRAGVIPAPTLGVAGPADQESCYLYGGEHKEPYYLPREVVDWAELDHESDPTIYGLEVDDGEANDFGTTLSGMNDRGDTFEEIAEIIEDHL